MTQYPGPQYPTQFPGYQSPTTPTPPLRPTSVTVLAVIGIIFGAFWVLCKPVTVLFLFMPQPAGAEMPGDMKAINTASAVIGTPVSALLLAASIGCLSLKPWARKGMLIYAALAVVLTLANAGLAIWMLPRIQEMQKQMMAAQQSAGGAAPPPQMMNMIQTAGTVGTFVMPVIALIYPLCLLYFFTRPNVKSAFGDPAHGAAPYGAPPPGGGYYGGPQG